MKRSIKTTTTAPIMDADAIQAEKAGIEARPVPDIIIAREVTEEEFGGNSNPLFSSRVISHA